MIGVVIGPAWIILKLANSLGARPYGIGDDFQPTLEEDLIFLIMTQLAHYWRLGSSLLSLCPFLG